VLAEHPAVRAAAVLLREDAPGEPRLVAYAACPAGGAVPGVDELRETLRKKLPEYMVPASFVLLPELPRTVNGKVDRAALPPPAVRQAEDLPRQELEPLEEVLAGMMAEVLCVEQVGLEDSFFELGGHSLRALELISMVQEAFELEVPLFHLFDAPTVSGLAAYLREEPERRERVEATAVLLLRMTANETLAGREA
jgi:acyl carrier protein